MRYKLLVFDMDGTILDTLCDLCDSTNYALSKNGMPKRTIDEVRCFVGNGIRKLMERAVPKGTAKEDIDKVHETFTTYYEKHCADKTKPYDGILELLRKVKAMGIKTAVVSNKADYAVQILCRDYFESMFDYAVGDKEGLRRKPYPDSVNEVLKVLDIEKEEALYIGDSDVDIMTAKNSLLDMVAVSWGFRGRDFLTEHGAKIIIDTPDELLDIIK